MKNVSLYFLFLVLAIISCNSEESKTVQVSGTVVNNPEQQVVYLEVIESGAPAPRTIDTATLSPGEAVFKMKGIVADGENLYRLRFEKENVNMLLISDIKKLSFYTDWKNTPAYSTNSPASNSMHNLLLGFNNYLRQIDSVRQIMLQYRGEPGSDSAMQALQAEFDTKVSLTENFLINYADTAKSHTVAMYALGLGKNQIEADALQKVMTNLARRFAGIPEVTNITTEYFNYMRQQEEGIVGKTAPEINLPDPEGKMIALSSLRGKYVLVDFWASWCKPCRMENPNVVDAFNKFRDKNFTILGVSLDKDKEPWVQAIKDDNLTWSHISDLKFWNSVVVGPYQIEGIPFNVLVDPSGKIIASNLRGPGLHQKLQELLQ